ncbi:TPA: hypothetical protein N0F65_003557 [Lagenidium giganteum]|uniref:Uncharacterized protein n=1 Tax=Lagenidium giganteum TaxID=4803 RepID=A0AAV2YXQ6_9STRA|nr:TPA: hypothetical protein N0F65_003557 [Lagenidium giganteum]
MDRCVYEEGQVLKNVSQSTDETGFPVMMRRDSGRTVVKKNARLDNRWVVSHYPYLSHKYSGHINVEMCGSRGASSCNGSDRARVKLSRQNGQNTQNGQRDEIKTFLDARYISNDKSHSVTRLPLHIQTQQIVMFRADERPSDMINRTHPAKLTRCFELCASEDEGGEHARTLVYHEVPMHFTWKNGTKNWAIRKRGGNKVVERLVACSPRIIERYHLRLRLCNVKSPTSLEDIRTVDSTCFHCMEEAAQYQMPKQLRQLFVTILLSDIRKLWEDYLHCMSEDYLRTFECSSEDRRVVCATVRDVNDCLLSSGKCKITLRYPN